MKISPKFPNCYKETSKPHKFCPGCGHPLALKMLGEAIDEAKIGDTTVFFVDIGCSLLAWDFFDLPTSQTHHGRTIPVALGFKRADPDKNVIAYLGDGGGYAIGLQHTISACLRNEPIAVVLINNTVYAMTGGQLAPTTISGETTTTTPEGKIENQALTLKGPELLFSLGNPKAYLARGTVANPLALKVLIKQAFENQKKGHFSFLEVLSFCPVNWKTSAKQSLENLKSLEKIFPVKEFK